MSVSLLEVLNSAGYDIETSRDDANWLLSVQSEFDDLVELAEETMERSTAPDLDDEDND